MLQLIYLHCSSPTVNIHCNPLVLGSCNAAIGNMVDGGNTNSLFNCSLLRINPLIFATWLAMYKRSLLLNACIGLFWKCVSISLGNTAYWHFLHIMTRHSLKWINWSIIPIGKLNDSTFSLVQPYYLDVTINSNPSVLLLLKLSRL